MVAGISIRHWGPCAWNFLHTISFTYSDEPTNAEKESMYNFLHAFANVLPCKKCRVHFSRYISKYATPTSPIFDSREKLVVFIHEAHNDVNQRLGKAELSLNAAKYKYLVDYDCDYVKVLAIGAIVACVIYGTVHRHRTL